MKYKVYYKCRPVGAQGTFTVHGTEYVNATDEISACGIAIDQAYINSNNTIEHVTIISCEIIEE